MIIVRLFYEFFVIGLFSIGGGLATLPFLYDMSDRTGWFSQTDVTNMLAVSESTPGAIGVNMASYVGYETAGIAGSLVATIALVMPSVIIILILAHFLRYFQESTIVTSVFYGLRAASTGLVAASCWEVCKMSFLLSDNQVINGWLHLFNWKAIIVAICLFVVMEKSKKHPFVYLAMAAVIGILLNLG